MDEEYLRYIFDQEVVYDCDECSGSGTDDDGGVCEACGGEGVISGL